MKPLRNTWAEIDLDQLARNVALLREYAGPGVRLAPVIKADAYGHGAVTIARELCRLDVEYLAVAILSEALELRHHGIAAPILVMGYTEDEHLDLAVRNSITLTISDIRQAGLLSESASRHGETADVHIKVDTGFHRLGKEPSEEFASEIADIASLPALAPKGIFTHLRLEDDASDAKQYALFTAFVSRLAGKGIRFEYAHVSDSIAAVKYPQYALNMIRPGAIIYGYIAKSQFGKVDVRPVMTFKTLVTRVARVADGDGVGYDEKYRVGRNAVIATLAAGYADGYMRHLSNKGEVLIRNQRAKVAGIVCMDQMMVDVSEIPGVQRGDEAILFGPQQGAPTVDELALLAETNKNSIVSGISRRVPRVYIKGGAVAEILDYLAQDRSGEL